MRELRGRWRRVVAAHRTRARQREYHRVVARPQHALPGNSPLNPLDTPTAALLVGVYRHKNAETLRAFIGQSEAHRYEIRLWALDEVHEDLRAWTVGCGLGAKYELINQMLAGIGPERPVIVADDDIVMARGDLRRLLSLGAESKFGLFQAAHSKKSLSTYPVTVRRLFSNARETTFVEIGPLFVVSPEWRTSFLPFPENIGMGWGLEIDWYAIQRSGCRFGVVDDVQVTHLVPPGASYVGDGEEKERLERVMAEHQISLEEMQQELAVWRRWRRNPPWLAPANSKV